MQSHATPQTRTPELVSLTAWLKQIGRSNTTGWRWIRASYLHPINIAGRPYLTAEDIQQFTERAKRGEFAKPLTGAAKRAAETRLAKEGGR